MHASIEGTCMQRGFFFFFFFRAKEVGKAENLSNSFFFFLAGFTWNRHALLKYLSWSKSQIFPKWGNSGFHARGSKSIPLHV